MCAKLPCNHTRNLARICLLHFRKCTKFVDAILSPAAIKCCECLLAHPRGGNLTHTGDPRVEKLTFYLKPKNVKVPVGPPPHSHAGANH